MTTTYDQDAMFAGLDLVQRAGASQVEFGYQKEDVPIGEADWYAFATFHGARVIVEHHVGPVEAVEALGRRLLTGAMCRRCGEQITMMDGPGCRWRRVGPKWEPGCGLPVDLSIPRVR
jgi:hypothetical protein